MTPEFSKLSRPGLERAFAGLLFSSAAALVVSGAIVMALRAAFAA